MSKGFHEVLGINRSAIGIMELEREVLEELGVENVMDKEKKM